MIAFRPDDPFPLLSSGSHSYADAQEHAEAVDAWLGLEVARTEERIVSRAGRESAPGADRGQQLWIGLPPRALLTPYTELRLMLELLAPPPGSLLVDLGAGYGRMGFVLARHRPGSLFVGFERVEERVSEGTRALARAGCGQARLECRDLEARDFIPPRAFAYFIYDYGSREAIARTLRDLMTIAREAPIRVIGRGRATRDRIEREEPWLSQINTPEHHGNFSIYRS